MPEFILDNAVSLDTTDCMFNTDTDRRYLSIVLFFCIRQFSTPRLFLRLNDVYIRKRETLKTGVLIQGASRWHTIADLIGYLFVRVSAFKRGCQKNNLAVLIDYQVVFDGMTFLFATLIRLLSLWVFWPPDRALCAIMKKMCSFLTLS